MAKATKYQCAGVVSPATATANATRAVELMANARASFIAGIERTSQDVANITRGLTPEDARRTALTRIVENGWTNLTLDRARTYLPTSLKAGTFALFNGGTEGARYVVDLALSSSEGGHAGVDWHVTLRDWLIIEGEDGEPTAVTLPYGGRTTVARACSTACPPMSFKGIYLGNVAEPNAVLTHAGIVRAVRAFRAERTTALYGATRDMLAPYVAPEQHDPAVITARNIWRAEGEDGAYIRADKVTLLAPAELGDDLVM
jgi:hypothetical protein